MYNVCMLAEKKIKSFIYALTGLKIAWLEEHNFRFHIGFAVITLIAAWFFDLSQTEFLIIIFMIGFILTAEAFNTALEELCDKFQPSHDPHIAKIKDLAAAAVFIAATTALIVGIIIFTPYVLPYI